MKKFIATLLVMLLSVFLLCPALAETETECEQESKDECSIQQVETFEQHFSGNLEDCIAEAKRIEEDIGLYELVLLSDITLENDIELPEGWFLAVDNDLTIDLNGHKLSQSGEKASYYQTVCVRSGTLTVKDSVGGGEIMGNTQAINVYGEYEAESEEEWMPAARLVLEGGKISTLGYDNEEIYPSAAICLDGGEALIKGGDVEGSIKRLAGLDIDEESLLYVDVDISELIDDEEPESEVTLETEESIVAEEALETEEMPESEVTQQSEGTLDCEVPMEPKTTKKPEATFEPEPTRKSEETLEVKDTSEPKATQKPDKTREPEKTAEPTATPETEELAEQQEKTAGKEPESDKTPELKDMSEQKVTSEPDKTQEPEETLEVKDTPEPTVTPELTVTQEPEKTAEPTATPATEKQTEKGTAVDVSKTEKKDNSGSNSGGTVTGKATIIAAPAQQDEKLLSVAVEDTIPSEKQAEAKTVAESVKTDGVITGKAKGGELNYYYASADENGKLTFISEHGFSPFVFSLTKTEPVNNSSNIALSRSEAAPAPAVVQMSIALPKTGDMTILQSILSFFGVI